MKQEHRVELGRNTYIWNGNGWYDAATFMQPPASLQQELNAKLDAQIGDEDAAITDVRELIERAQKARDSQQLIRAERLLRRVLALNPRSVGGATVLSSVLRAQGHPEAALEATAAFRGSRSPALRTTRAAALCDLDRWDEAKKEIGPALAGNGGPEALAVMSRIKSARPDLYPGTKAP